MRDLDWESAILHDALIDRLVVEQRIEIKLLVRHLLQADHPRLRSVLLLPFLLVGLILGIVRLLWKQLEIRFQRF